MLNLTRYQWLIIIFVLFFIGACKQSPVPIKKQLSVQMQAQENEVPIEQIQIMVVEVVL